MIEYYLIRHGMTYGNSLKRYIGVTDEPLLEQGIVKLKGVSYPKVDAVFTSPRIRCLQTSKIIYPEEQQIQVVEGLAECNFGTFENKNYKELEDNPDYQAWIDSNGTMAFPEGESHEAFKARCVKAFLEISKRCEEFGYKYVAIIAHGGTIMSILETYGTPKKSFYEWWINHGDYWKLTR